MTKKKSVKRKSKRCVTKARKNPIFPKTYCSHCGGEFGPGAHGYSNCSSHKKLFGSAKKRKHKSKAAEKSYLARRQIRQTENVKKNPRPAYIIRGKFFSREMPYYYTGLNWSPAKSMAEKFPSISNAKSYVKARSGGKWQTQFPSLNTVGIIKA